MESNERHSTSQNFTLSEVSTFHLATLIVKGCDLLLDHESYMMEYKAPNLEE